MLEPWTTLLRCLLYFLHLGYVFSPPLLIVQNLVACCIERGTNQVVVQYRMLALLLPLCLLLIILDKDVYVWQPHKYWLTTHPENNFLQGQNKIESLLSIQHG